MSAVIILTERRYRVFPTQQPHRIVSARRVDFTRASIRFLRYLARSANLPEGLYASLCHAFLVMNFL